MKIVFHSWIHGLITWLLVHSPLLYPVNGQKDLTEDIQPRYSTVETHLPMRKENTQSPQEPIPHYYFPMHPPPFLLRNSPPPGPLLQTVPITTPGHFSVSGQHDHPSQYSPPGTFEVPRSVPIDYTKLSEPLNRNQQLLDEISARIPTGQNRQLTATEAAERQLFSSPRNYQNYPVNGVYYPSPMHPPPFNGQRLYRSLPILHANGYQIIRLRDLKDDEHNSWTTPILSGYGSGISQTYDPQNYDVASNSALVMSELDFTAADLNKKVDDDIVGSPLQIFKPQISLTEQHHPVDILSIPNESTDSNNTKSMESFNKTRLLYFKNSSRAIEQKTDQPSAGNFEYLKTENKLSGKHLDNLNIKSGINKMAKDESGIMKTQSVSQQSTKEGHIMSSNRENIDKLSTTSKFQTSNEKQNYKHRPQISEPAETQLNLMTKKMELPSPPIPNYKTFPMKPTEYKMKTSNDFYNPYRAIPQSSDLYTLQGLPFRTNNVFNSYNLQADAINKGMQTIHPSSDSLTYRYASNWNNYETIPHTAAVSSNNNNSKNINFGRHSK